MRLPSAVALEPRLAVLVPWMAFVTLSLWCPLVLHADHSWDDADPKILDHALVLLNAPTFVLLEQGPFARDSIGAAPSVRALEQPVESDDDWERFTPELRDALARNYVRRARIGPCYVYRPR